MSWVIYDELGEFTRDQCQYMAQQLRGPVYQPPTYSFKNRGVTMPPEYGQQALSNMAQQNTEEVYVNGKYLNRLDVAAAQQKFKERDAAAERRRLEEQKKRDEEAKRQAERELRASKHMTKRTLYGSSWLLLDPVTVRKALDRADKYGGMVSLSSYGTMTSDDATTAFGCVDAPSGTYAFLPEAK